jgi:hypothetical protein
VTVEPNDLATQLGVSAKSLRAWLRRTYPRSSIDHSTRWNLTETQVAAASAHFGGSRRSAPPPSRGAMPAPRAGRTRDASDEAYVIDLCNEILGERARRQHRSTGSWGIAARVVAASAFPSMPTTGITVSSSSTGSVNTTSRLRTSTSLIG